MSKEKKKHRYRHSEGKRWIEIRVKSPAQLFDARDPAPFRDRDLDDDFVEYVITSTKELSLTSALKLVIHVEEDESPLLSKDSIRESIRSFFAYQIELQETNLKEFVKRSQIFLMIGLIFLVVCISVAQSLQVPEPPGAIGILREGIVIFGWVSIWKPIELVLFDWYPLYEKIRYYKKILATEIDIRFKSIG